ncbi:Uncharacterised protein [Mycobacteroides abscessus subsp. abscessus]|nr:Uncharacterised protein [Mycobacteroides abscessus subsp. abscessus]
MSILQRLQLKSKGLTPMSSLIKEKQGKWTALLIMQ